MPFAIRDDVRLYWKLDGARDLPVLILLNSIGTDMGLWDTSVPHLLPAFRLLRIDTRGHGASDTPDGDYSLAMLADDVVAVMDAAGVQTAAVAGVSLGGMIAMELALTHPARIIALERFLISLHRNQRLQNSSSIPGVSRGPRCGRWRPRGHG
ncbi:alpha/beta fold hydrolase, partial [Sphingomonas sp. ZB1N12]